MHRTTIILTISLLLIACFINLRLGSVPRVRAQSPTLPTAPGTWAMTSGPPKFGASMAVVRPAGGAGVKHVATCVQGFAGSASSGGSQFQLNLYDGTVLLQSWYVNPTNPAGTFSQCDLNISGSANASMTLQWAPVNANNEGIVNLVGYDAQ